MPIGPSYPTPYVGDFPPFVPAPTQTPSPTFFPSMRERDVRTLDVYMIWAIVPDQPEAPWLITAWDSESIAGNEDGWLEELAKAEEEYGGRYVRVTKTAVNYDAVVGSFQPVEV